MGTEPLFKQNQLQKLKETLLKVLIFVKEQRRVEQKLKQLRLIRSIFKQKLKVDHPDIQERDLEVIKEKLEKKLDNSQTS